MDHSPPADSLSNSFWKVCLQSRITIDLERNLHSNNWWPECSTYQTLLILCYYLLLFQQLHEPLAIFQSVFQAMVLGFTPLFGHNNLPELDLRLAVHVLTWIYERHAEEVAFCLETLNVVEVLLTATPGTPCKQK